MSVTYNGAHSVAFVTKSSSGAISVTKSWDDLFLIPAKRLSVTPAQPNYAIVSIPGSSKRIDLSSQISGTLTYSGRSGSWDFYVDHGMYSNWAYTLRRLSTLLNGKRMVCVLRDDPSYPYSGRVILKDWRDEETYSTVTIEYDFDYAYDGSIDVGTLTNSIQWAGISDSSGTAVIVRAQEKTVSPIVAQQIIEPDRILGYNYLAKVTVREIPYREISNGNNGGKTAMIACDGQSGTPSPGSAAAVTSQTKTVTPQSTDLVVVPDSGYDYLSQVTVKGVSTSVIPKVQSKTVKPDESVKTVVPDSGYDYLSQVNVLAVSAQNKIVTPGAEAITVRPDNGYDYLKSVLVERAINTANITVQTKTVTPTSAIQEIVPDSGYDYLSKVTVLPGSNEDGGNLEPYTGDYTIFYVDIPDAVGVDLGLPNISSSLGSYYYSIYKNDVPECEGANENNTRLITNNSFPSGECEIRFASYGLIEGESVITIHPEIPLLFGANNLNTQYADYIDKIDFGNIVFDSYSFVIDTKHKLTSVRFKENSITSIKSGLFSSKRALSSIYIPNSVISIGSSAFSNCYCLSSITIPSSVRTIENKVFYNCYSLSSIVIPDGVTAISANTFYCCYALSSVTIPNSVTTISTNAFYCCYALSSVTIPNSVTSIGSNAFYCCYALSSVTIPNGVTTIGTNAFYCCYALSSVTIPNSVTNIGSAAFRDCYSLRNIVLNGNNLFSIVSPSDFPSISVTSACKIYVPSSSLEAYKSAEGWSDYADKIFPILEEGS